MLGIPLPLLHGRGATSNPPNRFERIELGPDPDYADEDPSAPRTEIYEDNSRSLISYNDSPDLPFEASLNPYRGCEHGCIYCYARPYHEYLGFSSGLDFETKIIVKLNAPQLLREELSSPKWKPQMLAMSGITDCYQPIERRLKITRQCLEVLLDFRNPVGIVTKNELITRDVDLLGELAKYQAASVFVSITTLDESLARVLEPRASQPQRRLHAIEQLTAAGVPTGVLFAPWIPGLNDEAMPAVLEAAAKAGVRSAGYCTLRLPYSVGTLFENWLTEHFPDRKEKVMHRIRALRGDKIYDSQFGKRMRGEGVFAEHFEHWFRVTTRKLGFNKSDRALSAKHFRRPGGKQLSLFP